MVIGFDASRAFVKERTGTENYSFQLLKALGRIDKRNKYIVYTRGSNKKNEIWQSNFRFIEIPLTRFWTQAGLAYRTWIDKLDLLFVPAHTLPVLRKPGLKTLVTIHDLGYEYLPQYHQIPSKYYLNWSTAYAVKHATKLIAVSKATKNDLMHKLHSPSDKIEVVYEGVERERFQKEYSIDKVKEVMGKYEIKGDYILSVGTVQPRKNYKQLIKSFLLVVNSQQSTNNKQPLNDALQLIIVGKKGWRWEEIIDEPKKLGIAEKVKFLEYVSDGDLPILYQNAKCFVLPSLYEGFGLPVLEAMAAGCPAVVSNNTSLPEVAGEAGILVDPNNIYSIAEGITKILRYEDIKIQEIMIKKGIEEVREFSWEKAAEKTVEIFYNLSTQ